MPDDLINSFMTGPDENGRFGIGLSVSLQSELALDGFSILDNALVGLLIYNSTQVSGRRGVIRDNLIGINIQNSPIVLQDAFNETLVYDNNLDLDTQDIPVPEAADAFGAISGE